MNPSIIAFPVIAMLFQACVSSSRYQSLASESEQLQLRNAELKMQNDSLRVLAKELSGTKLQLEKTEGVLIEFYKKYQDAKPGEPVRTYDNNEPKADSFQQQIIFLVKENSRLQDALDKNEVELLSLKNQLAESNRNQLRISEKNKSIEKLEQQLAESRANEKRASKEIKDQDTEIKRLKSENKSSFAQQKNMLLLQNQNEHLIDSLHSVIQLHKIKNKDLAVQISELDLQLEEKDRQHREKENEDKIELQNEITRHNMIAAELKSTIQAFSDSLLFEQRENMAHRDSFLHYKLQYQQLESKFSDKSKKKDELAKQKETIEKLLSDLSAREKSLASLNEIISTKNLEIRELKEKISAQQAEFNALSDKMIQQEESMRLEYTSEINRLRGHNNAMKVQWENLQSERDSLFTTSNSNRSELENYRQENASQKKLLETQTHEINTLRQTITSKLSTGEQTEKNLQDSLSQLNSEIVRMQHVNQSLESVISRNQAILTNSNEKSDSLQKKYLQLERQNENLKKQSVEFEDITRQLQFTQAENKNLKIQLDSSRNAINRKPDNQKSSKQKLSSSILQKLTAYIKASDNPGLTLNAEKDEITVRIFQSLLFEGETFALTQKGSEIITGLSNTLKAGENLVLILQGYGKSETASLKAPEMNLKRVNTIYKLMSISGLAAAQFELNSIRSVPSISENHKTPGILISIHAE